MQSLLAKMVLDQLKADKKEGDINKPLNKTLDYLLAIKKHCPLENQEVLESSEDFKCEREQMQKLGIDDQKVIELWENQFDEPGNLESECIILYEDLDMDFMLGIHLHPGVSINDMTYRGYLEGADL